MSVNQRLRERRLELHLTQTELARRLGVSPAVISNYEGGQNPVRGELLEKLIRELTIARAQLAAVQSDIDPKQAADAVILAVYALEQEGKAADEKAISAALKGVMERHPEWKAGAAQKAPDKAGADEQDKKPEAKGSPAGKVIF